MCFHFQNVRSFSKCQDGDNFLYNLLKGHHRCNIFENNFEGTPLRTGIKHLANNDGHDLEMSVSFS